MCSLSIFDGSILVALWPDERILAGLVTSKRIREQLASCVQRVHLVLQKGEIHGSWVLRSLKKFSHPNCQLVLHCGTGELDSRNTSLPLSVHCADFREFLKGLEAAAKTGWKGRVVEVHQWTASSLVESMRNNLRMHSSKTTPTKSIQRHLLSDCTHLRQCIVDLDGAIQLGQYLCHMTALQHLDLHKLSYCGVDGLRSIAKGLETSRASLSFLNASWSGMGGQAIALLQATQTSLTELNLAGNALDNDTAELASWLRQQPSLTKLDITHSVFPTQGIQQLCSGLQFCTSLRHLLLGAEDQRLHSEEVEAIGNTLAGLPLLSRLDLCKEQVIRSDALTILARSLQRCSSLRFLGLGFNACTAAAETAAGVLNAGDGAGEGGSSGMDPWRMRQTSDGVLLAVCRDSEWR